ncbi:MAG: ribosomal-processing cysteine protease Prp [Lachnospiraceae bacterium]|nr:ribosomal-processing cysteine protease Prp [Lachnospiraceae bacterium]
MIKVTVSKNSDGVYNSVCIEGHAEYAEHGQDIVCAAVSVLLITAINSIESFTNDEKEEWDNEGNAGFRIISTVSKESELLIHSLLLGLNGIEKEYGKKYIRIYNKA